MTIINYFFEIVVPQILEYFKENKEEIPNYLMLEVLKKDKQYQELIDKILEQSKEENDNGVRIVFRTQNFGHCDKIKSQVKGVVSDGKEV